MSEEWQSQDLDNGLTLRMSWASRVAIFLSTRSRVSPVFASFAPAAFFGGSIASRSVQAV